MAHIIQLKLLIGIHYYCINAPTQRRIAYNKGFIIIIRNVAEPYLLNPYISRQMRKVKPGEMTFLEAILRQTPATQI